MAAARTDLSVKVCGKCKTEKTIDQFGQKKNHNGKFYPTFMCRTCSTQSSKEWAAKNPDKRKAIWRRHAEVNRESYAEANRRYFQRHRERRMEAMQRYWAANPGKRAARHAVAYALQTGRLTRKPCEECGSEKRVHAHHHDYDKPLDVKWLCSLCHGKEHRAAA